MTSLGDRLGESGGGTGVWYCPLCGYVDPLTTDTHCPSEHPS
jgi:rubrerythrin